MDVLAARITGFHSDLGVRLSFGVANGGKASVSSEIDVDEDEETAGAYSGTCGLLRGSSSGFASADGASPRQLDIPLEEPLSIPVFSRSAPMIIKLNSTHSLLRRTDAGSAAFWLNTVSGAEEELEIELPLDS